jgi:alpha-beta hydrolase superfamily lysophospholipase
MRHIQDKVTTSDGFSLYTQTWATEGEPKAILLIVHGIGDHSSRYHNYVDYFVPRGYTLTAFDSRGSGRSNGPRGHVDRFDRFVADIDQIVGTVRAQSPTAKLFILGHSLGSLMVLSYGLQHSAGLAGIITTGTALQDALNVPQWLRRTATVLSRATPTVKINNGVLTKDLSHDAKVVEAYERDPLVHRWATPRLATEVDAVRATLYRRAGEWRVPLLMLHGSDDHICLPAGAKLFQSTAPSGLVEYREYPGLYHEIHNEAERGTVFRDIEQWLNNRL